MQLARLTPTDAPAVTAFMRTHYPPAYAYLWHDAGAWYLAHEYAAGTLAQVFAQADVEGYWLQDKAGECLGWIQWERKTPPGRHDAGAYLHRLYLATAVQGRGLGTEAMARFHAWAADWGAPYCWLESMTVGRSRGFYARLGYAAVGEVRLPFAPMRDELRGLTLMVRTASV